MSARDARTVAAELLALEEKATAGPWAFAQTAEKGYGATIGAPVYAEDDEACSRPLAGDLTCREDDYYVDQALADLSHQKAYPDAALIVAMRNGLALVCRALLEEAQDRERLDAIEADEMQIATYERDLNGEVSETLWCVYDGNGEQHSARTLRTAIDAARSTEDAR